MVSYIYSNQLNTSEGFVIVNKFFTYLILALYEKAELQVDEQKPNHLMVLMSSDRGLCGGIHSSLTKAAKAAISEQPSNVNTMIIPCGDKARTILQKTHGE